MGIRHPWWLAGIVGGLAGGLIGYAVASPRSQLLGRTVWRGPRDRKQVALTFDNGPSPQGTELILDILRREGVPATFFLLGKSVQKYPDLARAIADEGHVIGNHGFTHRSLFWLGPDATAREIDRGFHAIATTCDVLPRLFRPAYGVRNFFLADLLERRGWQMVHWSRSAGDWRQHGARRLDSWIHRVEGGDILLWHDGTRYSRVYPRTVTVAALSQVIPYLRDKGFQFVTVDRFIDRA